MQICLTCSLAQNTPIERNYECIDAKHIWVFGGDE